MTAVARAETKVALLRDMDTIVDRLRANEAEHNELLEQRAAQCMRLREAGVPIKELQEVLGVSRSRVQQILRGSRI